MENREIKFRAWNEQDKQMIQPCCAEIYKDGSYSGGVTHATSTTCILMQYTGTTDSKGTEIYYKDVIELHKTKHMVDSYIGGFGIWIGNEFLPFSTIYDNGAMRLITVIGNIYENPELLK